MERSIPVGSPSESPQSGSEAADPFLAALAARLEHTMGSAEREAHYETPGDLARAINPKTVQTPALDLIDAELRQAFETPDSRLIITMPPQEGKSTRCGVWFPLWVLDQRPDTRIVMTSFSDRLARRNSRQVRSLVKTYGEDLDLQLSPELANQNEWQLAGRTGGIFATSVGGELTGQPADLLIIDDPHKGAKEADSEGQRDDIWEWWLSTVSTRLAPGAPVIMILTRWHEDDLAGKFLSAEDGHIWRVVNIPAEADHRPEQGETDPLGRQPGEWLESARRRTAEQWAAIKARTIGRTWNALYQGRPSAAEGTTLKREWWKSYDAPMWTVEPDGTHRIVGDGMLTASWDMTFKDSKGSDYVVGQVWLQRGANAYLVDQVRARMGFTASKKAVVAQLAKWPQIKAVLVEDKANGTAILDSLRAVVPGLIAVNPQESKVARAEAVTPFIEAGNVWLPSFKAFSKELVDEAAAFPTGQHDDQVDATSQALNRIFIRGGSAAVWLDFLRRQAGGQ